MGSLIKHIRYAVRLMVKQPSFTAMAVAVLALGIGANSAMFSLVNAFLFAPLLIRNPGEIVGVYSRDTRRPDSYRAFSYPEYAELRGKNTVFTSLIAHNLSMVGLAEGDTTRRVFADSISSNYFDGFGVPLFRGRTFTPEEERPGSAIPVVIVSHSFWRRTGADPALVGATLRLNSRIFTVVGIAAEGFTGSTALISPELFLPLGMYETVMNDFDSPKLPLADPRNHNLILVGRLKRGLNEKAADERLAAMAAGLDEIEPDDRDRAVIVRPLSRLSISTNPTTDRELRVPSLLLLFMSGIVLLIASLNVANMMLARGIVRRKEIAIRLALGAGRAGILAQLFIEGLVLALLGGAAGLVAAYWSTTLLVRSLSRLAPLDLVYRAAPDPLVLAATMGFCLISTLLFALGPAWNLSRPNVCADLKCGEQEASGGGKLRRLASRRNLLVIGQLALSLMLLSTAGLFVRSAARAAEMNPGFRLENHLIVEIDPSLAGYGETRGREILQTALDRLRAVPGVESASVAATVPFGMISLGRNIQRASDPPPDATDPARGAHPLSCGFNMVGADYFKTMGIGVLRGRSFLEIETAGGAGASAPGGVGAATPVVIIDKLAADRLWPGGDALGQRIRMLSGEAGRAASEAEVVGVVSSVQQRILGQEQTPLVYVPFGQEYQSDMNIHLKIAPLNRDAEARVVEAVRREIHAVDSRLPVLTLRSLRAHLEASFDIWLVRTAARMFAIFGAVALLLAAVGLYGVRAYAVVRRTREIGIRMAIGASSGDTLRMVLREGLYLTGIGAGVGLALSLVLGRVMAGMLYRVSGADPLVFSAAPLVLGGVSILACYFPARRASRLDPMAALRTE